MRLGRIMRIAVALLMFGCAGIAASAQDSAPAAPPEQAPAGAPVLHTESREVRVDVIVTDKKGKYVHDLTAKDFKIFDNDKEEPIVNFSFGSTPDSSGAPDRHYMVLFFDDSTMSLSDQTRSREAALKFIDANAGQDRAMAVVEFTGALRIVQNFSTDPVRLKQAAAMAKTSAVSPNDSSLNPRTSPTAPGPTGPGFGPNANAGRNLPSLSRAQNDFGVFPQNFPHSRHRS